MSSNPGVIKFRVLSTSVQVTSNISSKNKQNAIFSSKNKQNATKLKRDNCEIASSRAIGLVDTAVSFAIAIMTLNCIK